MKKNILYLILLFISVETSFSQNWIWSKTTTEPPNLTYHGLMTDNTGNVYSYGSLNMENPSGSFNFLTDTIGSYLFAYNPSGTLIFSKHWSMPFYIHFMQYDGSGHFYFAGSFYGSLVIDGVPIVSMGGLDGVTGKMDLNGTIVWMQTFGSAGHDFGNGVSFNSADNTAFSTGSINDSLYLNNAFTSASTQDAAIVLHYTSAGAYINHKTYDFIPVREGLFDNVGIEIENDDAGNTFVLMDRDGYYWNGTDSVPPAPMGRYIFKLNASLDTVWSRFIIGPGCYYGWEAHSLETSTNGDVYVLRKCHGQYGGTAELMRLSGTSGTVMYTLSNGDGTYNDLYIDGTTLYVLGTEGAFACPCPAQDPGYRVVKIIDENNILLGETRMTPAANVSNITKDQGTNIYFNGSFNDSTIQLGPDVLVGDSTDNGTFFTYWSRFLSKLSTTTCNPPTVSTPSEPPPASDYTLCPGDSVTLTVDLNQGSFMWSNGDTGTQTTVDEAGFYSVINTQPNGCVAYSLEVAIDVNENVNSHSICMVGFDGTSLKNKIIVRQQDFPDYYDIIQVNLYRDISGTPTLVESQTGATLPNGTTIVDSLYDPNTGSADYYISTIDTCGTESPLSMMHRTIYMSVGTDGSGNNVLTWNSYVGNTYTKYMIYKGSSSGSVFLYDSVNVGTNTYTDIAGPSNSFYQIEAVKSANNCYVNSVFYGASVFSNVRNKNMTVGIDPLASGSGLTVSPNPAQESFNVNVSSTSDWLMITLRNPLGQIIFSENVQRSGEYNKQIDMSAQPKGIYFLEVITEDQKMIKKIMKQ
jgi:hypothetical protein